MKFNVQKFQEILIKEFEVEAKIFNRTYANKTLFGREATEANLLKSKIDFLDMLICAITDSTEV